MEADCSADLAVLESTPNHAVRDRLALRLADARAPGAQDALLRLIAREDLSDHRGTLVYSLGQFDCSEYLTTLVDLVAKANFEVANLALGILDDVDRGRAPVVAQALTTAESMSSVATEDWRHELLAASVRKLNRLKRTR
jgi:hypothetical protein